uniref:Uncharacterized protein n=1 Tax=Human herpesvirus 2 TaxID=10310 RepID=A0A2H4PJH5_HHV2|nr:hypothetical protein [Human alphaherpesvirus 2]
MGETRGGVRGEAGGRRKGGGGGGGGKRKNGGWKGRRWGVPILLLHPLAFHSPALRESRRPPPAARRRRPKHRGRRGRAGSGRPGGRMAERERGGGGGGGEGKQREREARGKAARGGTGRAGQSAEPPEPAAAAEQRRGLRGRAGPATPRAGRGGENPCVIVYVAAGQQTGRGPAAHASRRIRPPRASGGRPHALPLSTPTPACRAPAECSAVAGAVPGDPLSRRRARAPPACCCGHFCCVIPVFIKPGARQQRTQGPAADREGLRRRKAAPRTGAPFSSPLPTSPSLPPFSPASRLLPRLRGSASASGTPGRAGAWPPRCAPAGGAPAPRRPPPPAPRVRERRERGPRRLFSIPGRGSRVAARRRAEGVPRPAVRPGPPAERGGPGAPGRAGGVSAFRFFSLPAAPLPGPTLAPSLLLVFPRPAAPLPSSFSLSGSLSRSPHIPPPPAAAAALCPRPTETPRRVSRPPGDPGSGGGRACVCLV